MTGSDDDITLIREAVAAVCRRFDDDYWAACEADHRFPWDFYRAMADGGWIGIAVPEAYGGAGRGITEAAASTAQACAAASCSS